VLDRRRTQEDADTVAFHEPCRPPAMLTPPSPVTTNTRSGADEYFYLPHRKEARGIGRHFLRLHDSGDWDADLASPRMSAAPS